MITGTILDTILEHKRSEVERHQRNTPLSTLEERISGMATPLNLSGALAGDRVRLIAEVKKASPSKGLLSPEFDPVALATCYADNGAAGISVLTEVDHFQGSLQHLSAVKEAVSGQGSAGPSGGPPVLRKDFLYDPYQIYESRAWGADAVLLIVAMLEPPQLEDLLAVAQGLWLQALVEVHSRGEMETALKAGAEIVGINHRDLKTFNMDLSLSAQLRPLVPPGKVVVAESGISSAEDVGRMKQAGVHAVLVGEALMKAPDTAAKVRELAGV
jgi:indole-3-glycerol phosphate synthase